MPRRGLISGMRSPPNSDPPARWAEIEHAAPRRSASRSMWLTPLGVVGRRCWFSLQDTTTVQNGGSSSLIRVDCAASITEGAFDLLASAAFTALSAKTAKHVIEDVLGISECVAFWAGQFSIALTLRAGALRDDPCSFQASR
jgi:hypothetical protein